MKEQSALLMDQLPWREYRMVKRCYSHGKSGPGRITQTQEQTEV